MTWIKKHLRGPHKKLMELMELRKDVTIVIVDEHGTSKCCTVCDTWSLDTAKCRQMPRTLDRTQQPTPEHPDWHTPMVIKTVKPWWVAGWPAGGRRLTATRQVRALVLQRGVLRAHCQPRRQRSTQHAPPVRLAPCSAQGRHAGFYSGQPPGRPATSLNTTY